MAGGCRLRNEERNFLRLVNRAVFANPFGDARVELDRQIAGLPVGTSPEAALEGSLQAVSDRVRRLEAEHRCDIRQYDASDRHLLETALLFDFFHRFLDRFDRFIQDQADAGNTPLKVPFAKAAFAYLMAKGFNRVDGCRYFEVVYQLRRAFFFIHHSLVGSSAGMKAVRRSLWNNVFTHDLNLYNQYLWDRMEDFSTLLLGETGTGKGTAAAAIGRSGFIPYDDAQNRFVESFTESLVSLNLSQFPESLIESELFGHRKGAFTGAVEDYEGVFDRCRPRGAIFLDEIGEVAAPIQIKLLHVLQEREFSPVGSHDRHRFNGRVIAATNQSIDELRRAGRMRDDFFYRLCSDVIVVPPLRDRIRQDPGELDQLIRLIADRLLGDAFSDIPVLVREVIDTQLGPDYPWPGNVRELEQCVRRVMLNRSYSGEAAPGGQDLSSRLPDGIRRADLSARDLLGGYCELVYRTYGTYEAVARRLGLDRRTVKKHIEDYRRRV